MQVPRDFSLYDMNKEKINYLKSEMEKVMNGFNFKFPSECGKCGYKQEVDYFDYYANPFVLCSNCGKRASAGIIELSYFGEVPFYKAKFIDGHFKIVTSLTAASVDFSQEIVEEQEQFFDYNWDFAGGVVDIYTSFEIFLYQLTFKRIEEFMNTSEKLEMDDPEFKDCPDIRNLIGLINSSEKTKIELIMEGISDNFRVKDCIKLLKIISPKDVKNFDKCYGLQVKRNNIVHRGLKANFEDYAEVFITVGRMLNAYNLD